MSNVLKFALISLMALLVLAVSSNTATAQGMPPADNNFTSNTVDGAGHSTVSVTVNTTTATDWDLQKQDAAGVWSTVQSGTTTSQTFTIACDNPMTAGTKYRVKGHTSGQSGPYGATATTS